MSNVILFSEKQKMKQWWLMIPLVILNLVLFIRAIIFFVRDHSIIKSYFEIFFPLILVLLITILIYSLNLRTIIKDDGIYVQLFPFHRSLKHYTWNDLDKVYVRKYNPIKEFGGWGLKGTSKNRAYNLSGDIGLQLLFKDGHKLLIGTKMASELTTVLREIGKYNH